MQEPDYSKNNIKELQETLLKIYRAEFFNESVNKTVKKCLQVVLEVNTLYLTVNEVE